MGAAIAAPGRIRLHLSHIPWSSIDSAVGTGKAIEVTIKVTIKLSNASGKPLFASLRADTVQWAL
jgi:hypothetical protein